MNTAPERGAFTRLDKEKAPRRAPQSLELSHVQNSPGAHPNHLTDRKPVASGKVAGQLLLLGNRHPDALMPARMRVIEITRLLQDRHRGPCQTDDALTWLDEVVPHFATKCGSAGFGFAVAEWVAQNCPRLTGADIEDAVARILPNPPRYTSVAIGRRLNVRIAEARRLGLRYVRPVGWNGAAHKRQAKAAKAAALKAKRQATGKTRTPRALSIEKLAPWIALEMSRSTFNRLPSDVRAAHVQQAREARR